MQHLKEQPTVFCLQGSTMTNLIHNISDIKCHLKVQFTHYLFTLMAFQTCMIYFILLNTREDVSKNVHTVKTMRSNFSSGPH